MRRFGVLGTLTLFLLLMGSAFAFAQEEKPKGDDKPKAEEARPQENAPRADEHNANREDKKAQKDQEKAQKEQEKNAKRDEKKSHDDMNARQDNNRPMDEHQRNQHPADNRQDMARNNNRGGARGGKHIPDDKFRAHFGRQHTFHVQRTQIVNVSQPVVVYGGYNFQLVDAWPVDWGYDDDCYIDYVDDGYYLFDVLHPGIRIAVIVAE